MESRESLQDALANEVSDLSGSGVYVSQLLEQYLVAKSETESAELLDKVQENILSVIQDSKLALKRVDSLLKM